MRFLSILIFMLSVRSLAQVRIMMIDAGTPDRSVYPTKGINFNVGPPHYHGTAMYQFLTMGPSASSSKYNCSFTVDTCSFSDNVGSNVNSSYYYCLKKAAEGNYDIINMSLNGGSFDFIEMFLIMSIKKSKIVVAAGNEGLPSRGYPAQFDSVNKGIIPISALDVDGKRPSYSNHDNKTIDFLGEGYYIDRYGESKRLEGTSVAAALYSNKLLREICSAKYYRRF